MKDFHTCGSSSVVSLPWGSFLGDSVSRVLQVSSVRCFFFGSAHCPALFSSFCEVLDYCLCLLFLLASSMRFVFLVFSVVFLLLGLTCNTHLSASFRSVFLCRFCILFLVSSVRFVFFRLLLFRSKTTLIFLLYFFFSFSF